MGLRNSPSMSTILYSIYPLTVYIHNYYTSRFNILLLLRPPLHSIPGELVTPQEHCTSNTDPRNPGLDTPEERAKAFGRDSLHDFPKPNPGFALRTIAPPRQHNPCFDNIQRRRQPSRDRTGNASKDCARGRRHRPFQLSPSSICFLHPLPHAKLQDREWNLSRNCNPRPPV